VIGKKGTGKKCVTSKKKVTKKGWQKRGHSERQRRIPSSICHSERSFSGV